MGPLLWSWCGGASARPAGHRNRAAKKRRRNPGSGRRTGDSRNAMWAKDDGRTEEDEGGENWRELDARKGKEREGNRRKRRRKLRKSETEPATGKTKTEAEYYPDEIRVKGEKRLE